MFPKCTSKELVLDLTKDVYLLDNGRSCAEFIFQTLQFVAVIYLVVFSLLFPFLLVFFTLRQRKWNLLDTDRMKYGPVYDAYNNRYCFWEAIVLLRLLISLCLTDTYPIGPFIQVYGQLTLTGLYLLLVIAFRPYRHVLISGQWHGHFVMQITTLYLRLCPTYVLGSSRLYHILYSRYIGTLWR
ncbi:hypothetical protein CHS0354_027662 [Potamilus streckersoni]|uniref:Uncharacterized protein n=1 Tax=Potamilus streckersoni TaxID=2493646 RepID=A0AAE0T0K8_9BIVA|nr:hypothetical protein CHS0354_027662 [Potamilus streckersoni]